MKRKPTRRRIVIGEGHPWFFCSGKNGHVYDSVQLTKSDVAESILLRGGEKLVPIDPKGTGNWNRVRLVLEVIDGD